MDIPDLATSFQRAVWSRSPAQTMREFVISRQDQCPPALRIEFLAASLKGSELRYGIQLMLAWPELWEGLKIDGWEELFSRMGPRPDVMQWQLSDGLSSGEFADVVFLLRWLRLDALYLVKKTPCISCNDKRMIAAYCAHGTSSGSILSKNTLAGLWRDENDLLTRITASRSRLGEEDSALLNVASGIEELRTRAIANYTSL